MSRPLRIEYEHAFYHITARGNERRAIFEDRADRERFLGYLELLNKKYKIKLYAYVLMDNHYHLLMETPEGELSRIMRDLNGHYTIYYNKRHERVGHLFQGRYKAILIDRDNYLLELTRYIHLNPVRAKVERYPERYEYSSFRYYLGEKHIPIWLDISWVLCQLRDKKLTARQEYKGFVYEGIKKELTLFHDVYANSILGETKFIKCVQEKFLKKRDISSEVPGTKQVKYGKDLKAIEGVVLDYYTIKKEALRKRDKFNTAKKIFVIFPQKSGHNGERMVG